MRPLLECDAIGPFFQDAPMMYFGGTPIAYLAVFGMKNLLEELVGDPIKVDEAREKAGELKWLERSKSDFTLDGMPMPQPMRGPLSPQERYYLVNELRCKFTEYLPIHAVVASDNHVMYDFMVDICGANARLEVHELSALKLAVVLGKQAMVKHILKRRLKIHWTWGPVTQYMIPLDEIDTAGSRVIPFPERCLGNLQLLELVVAPNAKKVTSKMILDSFMNGFFFKLIEEKWDNNAKYWWYFNIGIHLFFTLQLTYLAAPSILDPRLADDVSGRADVRASYHGFQLWLAVGLSLFILEEELRETVLWIGVRLQHFSLKQMCIAPHGQGKSLRDLPGTMMLRRAYFRIPMALLTLLAAFFEMYISTLRAEIEAGDGDKGDLMSLTRSLEEWPSICLAFAAGLAWWLLMIDAFQQSENLGTFSKMVLKMLSGDILFKFLPLYVPILLGFTTSMHAIYPQKTSHERWSSWWQTFESLVLFSLVGEAPDIALSVEGTGDSHPLDMLSDRVFRPDFAEGITDDTWSSGLFVMLYVLFVLVVLLLMINLLIAMMSSTYDNEKDSARLQWRILFARLVLRYELLNLPLAMLDPKRHETRVMVGDSKVHDREVYLFRSYDKDAPLNLDGKGGDIFADVELELEGDDGDKAPPPAGPTEMSEKHVEMVARRLEAKLEDIVLKQLGGLAAPAAGIAEGIALLRASQLHAVEVKQPQLHAIDPRAPASHFGDVPRYKAANDMEVARPRPPPPTTVPSWSHQDGHQRLHLGASAPQCLCTSLHLPLCTSLQSLIASAQRTAAEVQRSANRALLPPVRCPPPFNSDGSERPRTVQGQLFSQSVSHYDA